MTHIIYELALHPSHISKLRKELASIDPSICPSKIQHLQLQHLDHLNGVIYETLRLHPPVPTALQRLTPPEGLTIGGVFIPGNTTVWSPQYVLGRCELPRDIRSTLPPLPRKMLANHSLFKANTRAQSANQKPRAQPTRSTKTPNPSFHSGGIQTQN